MPGLFISYRRNDQPGFVGRIYDRLAKHFAGIGVFMDVRTINAGQRFDRVIADNLSKSDLTLVVIGDRWNNNNRLNDLNDWVRQEIVESLKLPDRTIPILLDDAELKDTDLPEDMRPLVFAPAIKISHANFEKDAETLISQLRRRLKVWDEVSLLAEAEDEDRSGATATKLKAIFQWAGHRGFQLAWGKDPNGSVWLQPPGAQKTVFSSTGTGTSYVYMKAMKELQFLKDEEACRNFIAEMNRIPNLLIPDDRAAAASFGFQLRNVLSINRLIELLDRTLH